MELENSHEVAEITKRLAAENERNYVRDGVYGGIDGAVTTFAIVAGVVGAQLSSGIILILGLANLLADGFSMAASNYSGTKTEIDDRARLREVEKKHIRLAPEGEREEIRQIYRLKGFDGELLEEIVRVITADHDRWADTMMTEEHGLPSQRRSPWMAASTTFAAFLVCGAVPLFPYVVGLPQPFMVASGLTAVVFFTIGSFNSRWTLSSWWLSGLRILAIGSAAASLAYLIGWLLRGLA